MTGASDAKTLRDEEERVDQARRKLSNRQWLKDFTLVVVLIVMTVAIATLLAGWAASGK
jgi:hypothetical protein